MHDSAMAEGFDFKLIHQNRGILNALCTPIQIERGGASYSTKHAPRRVSCHLDAGGTSSLQEDSRNFYDEGLTQEDHPFFLLLPLLYRLYVCTHRRRHPVLSTSMAI